MKCLILQLYSTTFLWRKNKQGLLYNSLDGSCFLFELTREVNALCLELEDPENFYTVKIETSLLEQCYVLDLWIKDVCKRKMGCLRDYNSNDFHLSFPPIVSIKYGNKTENIMNYLHELVFYISGSRNVNVDYYKQILYPISSVNKLCIKQLVLFLQSFKTRCLQSLYFVGIEVLNSEETNFLFSYLSGLNKEVIFVLRTDDFIKYTKSVNFILVKKNVMKFWIICHSLDEYYSLKSMEDVNVKMVYVFLVRSTEELMKLQLLNNLENNDEIILLPIFVGNNISFFEDHIFLSEQDICDMPITKREVFLHQTLNLYDFGRLVIMPDGTVYANLNESALGEWTDPLYDIIHTELMEGNSWLYIRDKEPCLGCVYQWLCPSPSNYERVLQKKALCFKSNV